MDPALSKRRQATREGQHAGGAGGGTQRSNDPHESEGGRQRKEAATRHGLTPGNGPGPMQFGH